MKTCLQCIPCFFRQALEAAELNGLGEETQRKIVNTLAGQIPSFKLDHSPVEMAGYLHRLVREEIDGKDPYARIKKESNKKALTLYPRAKEEIQKSETPLLRAIQFAAAGNIIDFGVKGKINIEDELNRILEMEEKIISKEDRDLFDYEGFSKRLAVSKTMLYIGDNAGEIVFDKLLIEEIDRLYPDLHIYFAVRGGPIINDVTEKDAKECGIDKIATVISSGADIPGIILPQSSQEFVRLFFTSDLVLSKGQGNFESLSSEKRLIYFLFIAKCAVIADHVNADIGAVLLLNNSLE